MDEGLLQTLAAAEADRRWGSPEELLAIIAELIHEQTRTLIQLLGGKGARPPQPLRLPRPGAADPTPTMSMGEMARRLIRGR